MGLDYTIQNVLYVVMCNFNEMTIFTLGNTILLRCIRTRRLMQNTTSSHESSKIEKKSSQGRYHYVKHV